MSDVGKKIIKRLKEFVEVSPTLRDFEVLAKLREAFPHYVVVIKLDDDRFSVSVAVPECSEAQATSPFISLVVSCREEFTRRIDALIRGVQEALLTRALKAPVPAQFPDVIHIVTRVISASPFVPTGEYTTTPTVGKTWLLHEEDFRPIRAQPGDKGFILVKTE